MPSFFWYLEQPFSLSQALMMRLMAPVFGPTRRRGKAPWVIGGHRGRMFEDNAKAIFLEAQTQRQPIIWLANKPLQMDLEKKGYRVLRRNSLRARLAILKAPIAITSHGDDDLDTYALLWRKKMGIRVHVNHCLKLLKTGQWARPHADEMRGIRKWLFEKEVTYFDYALASSPLEAAHFRRSFPDRKRRVLDHGGGAHIDSFIRLKERARARRILWFPTFREGTNESARLEKVTEAVLGNQRLHDWLKKEDRYLVVCHHINRPFANKRLQEGSRIEFMPSSKLLEAIAMADCLISDYSSVSADWLILGRPAVFFPFDLDSYQKGRSFFIPYEDYAYGPLVKTPEALIEVLESGMWEDMGPFAEKRQALTRSIFQFDGAVYASKSLETIMKIASFHRGNPKSALFFDSALDVR